MGCEMAVCSALLGLGTDRITFCRASGTAAPAHGGVRQSGLLSAPPDSGSAASASTTGSPRCGSSTCAFRSSGGLSVAHHRCNASASCTPRCVAPNGSLCSPSQNIVRLISNYLLATQLAVLSLIAGAIRTKRNPCTSQDQHGFPLPHPELAKEQAREAAAAAAAAAQRGAAEPSEFDVSMLGMSPDSGLPRFTASRLGGDAWARTWVPDACGNVPTSSGQAAQAQAQGRMPHAAAPMVGGTGSRLGPGPQLQHQQPTGLPAAVTPQPSPAPSSVSNASTATQFGAHAAAPSGAFPAPVPTAASPAPPLGAMPPRV